MRRFAQVFIGFEINRGFDSVFSELNTVARIQFCDLDFLIVEQCSISAFIVNQIKSVGFRFDISVLFRHDSFGQGVEANGAILAASDGKKAFGQMITSTSQRSAPNSQT